MTAMSPAIHGRLVRTALIRTCIACGTEFVGRADAAYCSAACRQKAYRKRHVTDSTERPVTGTAGWLSLVEMLKSRAESAPIPIGRKTRPNRKARAEARHSLVAAAIALQTVARQLNSINAVDLEFDSADKELGQAPAVIADAVKTITNSLEEIAQRYVP